MKVEIEVITYERDRLDYFTDLMGKAQKRYKSLFKKYKDAPMLSAETEMLNEAGRVAHFHGDVVEMLENGYRKQSVGEWVEQVKVARQSNLPPLYYYKCSLCGVYLLKRANFCPNCGAKMKGESDERSE